MIEKQLYAVFAFLLLWLSSPTVRADILDFTLTGEGSTYSFQLPSSPSGRSNDFYFTIPNVIITIDGGVELAAGVIFFTDQAHGGLEFFRDLPQLDGAQVFSVDDEGNPTFITATYGLVNREDDASYTLTIAAGPPGGTTVPEPGSWLLLLTGFVVMAAAGSRLTSQGPRQPHAAREG
jgi:hypothetical protein